MNPPNKEEPPPSDTSTTNTNTSTDALLPSPNILLNHLPNPLQLPDRNPSPSPSPSPLPTPNPYPNPSNLTANTQQSPFDPSSYAIPGNTFPYAQQQQQQLPQSPPNQMQFSSLYSDNPTQQQPLFAQSARPSSMRLPAPSRDWLPIQQQYNPAVGTSNTDTKQPAALRRESTVSCPTFPPTATFAGQTHPQQQQQQSHQLLSPIPTTRRPRAIDIPVSRHHLTQQQQQSQIPQQSLSLSPIPSPTYPARMRPPTLRSPPSSNLAIPIPIPAPTVTGGINIGGAITPSLSIPMSMSIPISGTASSMSMSISPSLPPLSHLLSTGTASTMGMGGVAGPSRIRGGVRKRALQHGCHLCPYRAHQSSDLKRHLATHQDLRPFRCPDCEHSFRQKAHLNAHRMAIHSRLKPHRCEVCSRTFAARSSLKRHVTYVHNKHPPFYCAHCPAVFQSVFDCQRHQQVSHSNNNNSSNMINISNSITTPTASPTPSSSRRGNSNVSAFQHQNFSSISPIQQQQNTSLTGNTSPSGQLPLFPLQQFEPSLAPLSTSTSPPSPSLFQHHQPQYQQQQQQLSQSSQFHLFQHQTQNQQQQRRFPPLPLPNFFDHNTFQRDLSTAHNPHPPPLQQQQIDDGNIPQPRVSRSPSLPIRPLMGGNNNNNNAPGLLSRAPSLPYLSRSSTRQEQQQQQQSQPIHRNILSRIRSAGTLPLPANLMPRQYQQRRQDQNENQKKEEDDGNVIPGRNAKNGDYRYN